VLEAERSKSHPVPVRGLEHLAAKRHGASVRNADRLVDAEEREVAGDTERASVIGSEPALRHVLDQVDPAVVTPPPPARSFLREPEIVGQVEDADGGVEPRLELGEIRSEIRRGVVVARRHTRAHIGFDLGPW
jgi:hypothetical protein